MLKKWLPLAIGVAVALLAACAAFVIQQNYASTRITSALPDYPHKIAVIGNETYTLLAPRTAKERQLGLGAVPALPAHYGMLFPGFGTIGIWMKGMKYSIDILWIDARGTVVHIEHDVDPSTYPKTFTNPKDTDARYVIELQAGEAKRLGLKNDSSVTFK